MSTQVTKKVHFGGTKVKTHKILVVQEPTEIKGVETKEDSPIAKSINYLLEVLDKLEASSVEIQRRTSPICGERMECKEPTGPKDGSCHIASIIWDIASKADMVDRRLQSTIESIQL